MRPVSRRLLATVTASALLAACASGTDDAEPTAGDEGGSSAQAADEELAIAVASFDIAVGEQQRLMAGVLTSDAVPLAFGEVTFEVGPIEEDGSVSPRDRGAASFLPVLGLEPEGDGDAPTLLVGEGGRGVYGADVDLDEPGDWAVRVTAELDDGTVREGVGRFVVAEEPQVPTVGEEAPRSENLTIADVEAGEATAVSVDSRAQEEGDEIPDPHVHDTTVADALDTGDPVVVMISTPTYCATAFCGPLTNELADMALEYEGEATFIHLEVWRDFEANELNDAAAEWIATDSGGNEPWVFLVDADGTIDARWDNIVERDELVTALEALR